MHFDFELLLLVLALVTGIVWLSDWLIFSRLRKQQATNITQGEPLVIEYSRAFFPVLLAVLVLRAFLFEPFRIPSGSMMPSLLVGDFILVNKFSYGFRMPVWHQRLTEGDAPEHGDVIVFRYPNYEHITGYSGVDFIKRVVALPGDTISYEKDQLIVNGESVEYRKIGAYQGVDSGKSMSGYRHVREKINEADHDILLHPLGNSRKLSKTTVPEGHYFVMGDNRAHSSDSRFWGYVPESYILGKAIGIWMHWDWNHNTMQLSRIGSFD